MKASLLNGGVTAQKLFQNKNFQETPGVSAVAHITCEFPAPGLVIHWDDTAEIISICTPLTHTSQSNTHSL